MNNNTRKIVVLNNIKSPKIEQAIFILRDDTDCTESDAVSEAEKIVSLYLENMKKPLIEAQKQKGNKFQIILSGLMCAIFSFLVTACIFTLIH